MQMKNLFSVFLFSFFVACAFSHSVSFSLTTQNDKNKNPVGLIIPVFYKYTLNLLIQISDFVSFLD